MVLVKWLGRVNGGMEGEGIEQNKEKEIKLQQ
jgi:hypothetical protein